MTRESRVNCVMSCQGHLQREIEETIRGESDSRGTRVGLKKGGRLIGDQPGRPNIEERGCPRKSQETARATRVGGAV